MLSERPFADGRRTAVFVFNALRADAGRLTRQWLARISAFDQAGWATHAVLINKDPGLSATVDELRAAGRLPQGTGVHHYALRDRRVRASWWGPLPEGSTIDPRVGDWLDWLTAQVPGAVVFADSPAAYPYVSHMSHPLVSRVAVVHLSHLAQGADPVTGPFAPRFGERFDGHLDAFDVIVVESSLQAADLRARYGSDLPVTVIPPFLRIPSATSGSAASGAPERFSRTGPSLLSTGPLERGSAHARVLDALPGVIAKHPETRLWILGDGKQRDALVVQAAELGLADRVTFVPAGKDPDGHLRRADVVVFGGSTESWPLVVGRALGLGIPVVAEDVGYGSRELITSPQVGELVPLGTDLTEPIVGLLDRRASLTAQQVANQVRTAAAPALDRADRAEVTARWVALGAQLADEACDHSTPSLLVDTLTTNTRVLRMPGILADSATDLAAWSCELPGLAEPAGWLTDPPQSGTEDRDDEDAPDGAAHAAGATREVNAYLRSNALAFVAVESDAEFRVELTDGEEVVPLLTTAFDDRVIASRVGNATLTRRADGSVWVAPRPELLFAQNVDGRILVRAGEGAPVSDVTHAIAWSVDIDWAAMEPTEAGAAFTGTLRARSLAPADDSAPAICVTDVGGYSRVVGQLHYTGEPVIEGLEWSAPVAGILETDPLVATTELARGALALHVGFPGLLVPVGGLWTYGHRERMQLECERGMVTILPSPGGRVIVAPGKGLRARVSGLVRSAMTRGTPSGP